MSRPAQRPATLVAPRPLAPAAARARPRRFALLGRGALVDLALRAVASAPLVTLRGPPGVGKSSLARALAGEDRSRPWLFVDAAHAPDARSLYAAVATALSVELRVGSAGVAVERLARALDEARSVLVVDHCDRVPEAVRAAVADLAASVERACVLCCAWRALGAADERVIDVPPLAPADAVALLRGRLSSLDAPALADEDAGALVCRASALPLALELLAGRVAALGVRAVMASLDEPLAFDPLDAALARSFSLLGDEDRSVLVALCTLRGPFDAQTARGLAGGAGALACLERLVASSLVASHAPKADGCPRFCVLDVVRDYVSRCHHDGDARARHARYFSGLPRALVGDRAGYERLVGHRADLLAAWGYAIECDAPCAARLALLVEPLLLTQGPIELHREIVARTLAALDARGDGAVERDAQAVDLRCSVARAEAIRGHFRTAIAPVRDALGAAERVRDAARTGSCAALLCFTLRPLGAFDEAREHGERALRCARELRSHAMAAQAEQVLALVDLARGRHEAALDGFLRAHASALLASSPRAEGIALANCAFAHQRAGRYEAALECLDGARRAFSRCDDRVHLARVAVLEQALRLDAGRDHDERALASALDEALALDDLASELEAREALARVAHAQGETALFDERLRALEACARFTDDVGWAPRVAALRALREPASGDAAPPWLALTRSGDRVVVGQRALDFSRRGPLKRVLLALVSAHLREPGTGLRAHEVQAAGWPGERMLAESGCARVYMAVRRLRGLGFERLLRTSDEGYSLDPRLEVRWIEQ